MEKETAQGPTEAGEAEARGIIEDEPHNAEATAAALERLITPAHFVRCHFDIPRLGDDHRLGVEGAVERPRTLDVPALRSLGFVEELVTLECAGNDRLHMAPLAPGAPWDIGAVSTALWGGVPLSSVLAEARPSRRACEVVFEGADRGVAGDGHEQPFRRALSLKDARTPGPLIAVERNRHPLEPEHGAPMRLVVPGWYGVASVKWLRRITVVEQPFEGWFQTEQYQYRYADDEPIEPVTRMRPRALITSPHAGTVVPLAPLEIRGWAWSGQAALAAVELSVDGVDAWLAAELEPAVGPYAWRAFRFAWTPQKRGRHTLRARAVDASGAVQPELVRANRLGYGNNAVRTHVIEVR